MTINKTMRKTAQLSAALAAVGLLALASASHAAPGFTATVFATGADVSASKPDSITVGGDHVFVEYGNGASSSKPLGTGGASTLAEYDFSGNLVNSFSALGSVDGLRYNADTGLLWVLQNQDGNSRLQTIDPTNGMTVKYIYASPSPTRGFDDVAFIGGKVYLSYTNPGTSTDAGTPIIYQATLGAGIVGLTSVLAFNATGTNTATGVTGQTIVANDPDSLGLAPDGSLLLTSGDDGSLTMVKNPGTDSQQISFVNLTDAAGAGVDGLDDTVFAKNTTDRLLVADTANNTIYSVTGDFTPGGAYSSIGSTNSLDSVNLTTGVVTSISGGLFAAGSSPHGLGFLPAAVPEASSTVALGLLLALGLGGMVVTRKKSRHA